MAETVPTISSDDHFSLGSNFEVQESTEREIKQFFQVKDETGDYSCSQTYDEGDAYTERAFYCPGGTTNIVTDLATFLTTLGEVQNSKLPTQLQIVFEAGVNAELTLEGHQHDTEPHLTATLRTADVSGVIPASSGIGVPDLITVGGDVSPVRATLTFTYRHIDKIDADGVHFSGQNQDAKAELSVTFEGHPSSVTAGNWLNVILEKNKPNDDTPMATVTAEQYFSMT